MKLSAFIISLSSLLIGGYVAGGTQQSAIFTSMPIVADVSGGCALPNGTNDGIIGPDGRTCCPKEAQNDPTNCFFTKYVDPAIQLLSAAMGIVVVIAVVYGAIEYITSAGDPQRANEGRKHITNALIALAAFILLYAFLQFILPGGIFGG